MSSYINRKIISNKKKLEHLIDINAPYQKILKQSQKVDKYIYKEIKKYTILN